MPAQKVRITTRRLSKNCDRSEDGGKLSGTASRLVFRLFERSGCRTTAEAVNSGDYLTKICGKIGRFATAAVGKSVLGQPPRHSVFLIMRRSQWV
jgi:hypothetical protein